MDAELLTQARFWADPSPCAPGLEGAAWMDMAEVRASVLFQTSGSTGRPKWIVLGKEALQHSARAVNGHLGVDAASCWGLALPMHHVGGFGVAARAFAATCRLAVWSGRWDPAAFPAWLAEAGVTHTSLVPTQVHDLVRAGRRAPMGLMAVVVGGGRLDQATGRAARALGWPVLASYGMTEAASQVATQGLESLEHDYVCAPLPLLPIWQVRIDAGGLLELSGPALFHGTLVEETGQWRYLPRPGAWHRTSDRVLCEDHRLTPLGRADGSVKILGELVDPEAVEHELAGLPGSPLPHASFAVVAVPDVRAGHLLVPVVESRVPEERVAAAFAAYHARVPGFLRLQEPIRLERLPRGPLGKLLRRDLAARVAEARG